MISDDQFVRGIQESVRLFSQKVPVYYYSFSHEGSLFGVQNRTLRGKFEKFIRKYISYLITHTIGIENSNYGSLVALFIQLFYLN